MAREYPPLPKSACKWSQSASYRIRQALGLKADKIPKNMHGRFKVDGYTVIVKRHEAGQRGTGKHRIFIDHGGREIPIGRMYQALCKPYQMRYRRRQQKRGRPGY